MSSNPNQPIDLPYARSDNLGAPPLPRGGSPPTSLPVLIAAMLLVLIPLVTLSQIAAHWRLDVVDDQMFGYYGWRIANGATVYKDVWDNKPPGIYWINALGFQLAGGQNYAGVIVLCITALIAAHIFFFVIAASVYYRGAAALATILASFYLTHSYYQCGTNRTETFLVPFELAAVMLYMRGFVHDRWWKWYVAGLCCGGAFLFKQIGLAAWGAMGLHTIILVLMRDLPWRKGLQRCLLLAGGAATTLLAAGLVLVAQGAFEGAWYATFTFNRAYFAHGDSKLGENYKAYVLLSEHVRWVLTLPLLMALAAWIHSFLWWLRPKFRPPEIEAQLRALQPVCPRYMLLFTIWLLASAYGAILSPHSFRHYIVPSIPPLLLIASYLVNVIMAEMNLLARLQQRAWVVAAFVAMGYFAFEACIRHVAEVSRVWVDRIERKERADWEVIGDEVARLTRPTDKIQCWGYMPGIYLQARRPNTCRFTTTEKIGQVGEHAANIKHELYEKLLTEPPAVFVISAGDYNWLQGTKPDGTTVPVDPLGHWLDERYERVADVAKFNIYIFKRKDLLTGT